MSFLGTPVLSAEVVLHSTVISRGFSVQAMGALRVQCGAAPWDLVGAGHVLGEEQHCCCQGLWYRLTVGSSWEKMMPLTVTMVTMVMSLGDMHPNSGLTPPSRKLFLYVLQGGEVVVGVPASYRALSLDLLLCTLNPAPHLQGHSPDQASAGTGFAYDPALVSPPGFSVTFGNSPY